MRVLAVDPGYDRLGVAIMEFKNGSEHLLYSDCIETDKTAPLSELLKVLGDRFEALLTTYSPDTLPIETLFF
ncbi:crossover junction endodeoxyribonuclease RuvC, partial [Candidatus Kaiserbacteria bacterium]|nr:crossover junction endodeoxyribonuclease RuvC [Candidatus Kaiserbacteria bacterium]